MIKVLIINQEKVPHYRVSAYNYLSDFLSKKGYDLTILSEGIQEGSLQEVTFKSREIQLTFQNIIRVVFEVDPQVVIYWVRLRYPYLFPMLLFLKLIRKKIIYWGHGSDLYGDSNLLLKQSANDIEYRISDALILYGEHLRKNIRKQHHNKTFFANNTIYFNEYQPNPDLKRNYLSEYGIKTKKNIIYMGRIQRRKRLEDLFNAFKLINDPETGLILVGPDNDGILDTIEGENIFKLGSIYGDERLDLLSAADVFCMPGPIGLSVVDSFYCGVPIVTEDGDESPESMYLKDGVNGFIVPKGDIEQLASKLKKLLQDNKIREQFSIAAKLEISTNGHIEKMCKGFSDALHHALTQDP